LLFLKLLKLGFAGKFYKAVKSIYDGCMISIVLNEYFTDWFTSDLGVKQGDVISPSLFGLFINDLIKEVHDMQVGISVGQEKVSILAFADDIVVMGNTAQELQQILDVIAEWGIKWRMSFNCSKTNVVHFRNKNTKKTVFNFNMRGMALDIVEKYKYLGIILNDTLDYSHTANTLADAGCRALGAITSKYKSINGLGFYTYSTMYKSGVCPVLDYASEIWGYKDFQAINKVQNRAIRTFLGVNKFASNLAIHGDLGWSSPILRRHMAMIRYYNRIISMDENRLPHKIFLWEKSIRTHGWAHEIEMLLDDLGMSEYFMNSESCNLNSVWAQMFAKESAQWKINVQNSRKLRTYRSFKQNLELEAYVISIMNRGYRSVLARLRAGVLPLQIETGRWRSVPADERFCTFCNDDTIEDETHFVFVCKMYERERTDFFNTVESKISGFTNKSNVEKFTILMTKPVVNLFARYVFQIFTKRQNLVYNST
jgi:hypothetical protein